MEETTSEVVEEYLLEIYILNQAGEKVKANKLAAALNSKPSTVFATLQRMKRDDLVKINRSKEITLTAKGSGLADNIAYRHNLAEYFLCNSLKIPWFEVHMHAHKLEHAMTPLVVEKLAEFLGQPQFCPHGTPMPGQSLPDNTLTLDHATVDTYVEIVMISEDLEDSLEIMQILQEKLIMPGYKHLVANISTALQSISLKQNNMETVLPMHVAKKIYAINVEEIKINQIKYDKYSFEKDPADKLFKSFFGEKWTKKFINKFLFTLNNEIIH